MSSRKGMIVEKKMANVRTTRWVLPLLLGISLGAAAQDTSQSTPATPPAPAPAFGQNAPILNPDNPPLSGLDEPSLQLKTASRSFISPALQIGESGDSNASNQLGGSKAEALSHILGAFDLQKFWPRSDLFLEYLGGGAFGDDPYYARQLQAVGLESVMRWRTGQLTLRDGFSYLPDGSFYALSAGGLPGYGIATAGLGLGLPGIYHMVEGSIGTIPRLSNQAIADVVQAINPRSAFTVVGAYSDSHFYHNTDDLLNGDESTVEAGYSHLINRHDQIALVDAFQVFRFPDIAGGEIYNNVMNIRYSHVISGRMSFVGGIGPQYTDLRYGGSSTSWSAAGRAVLKYRFEHTSLLASYEKFTSQGSGFFAGADTQVAQASVTRPFGRTYEAYLEASYSHNKRLSQALAVPGVGATSYNEGAAAVILRKHLNRAFDAIAAYRFADVEFNVPVSLGGTTGRINQRQIGTVALEWHPKAVRIE
ncbi:MAG: hypothetical protein ABSD39_03970 [Terriglobales bacterium]